MFKHNSRKRISIALAVVCCLSILVGSFAFFTDRETQDATAAAGNINLVFTDASKAGENKQASQTNTVDNVWSNGIVKENDVMNPGDTYDMAYTLSNSGSKSINVKQQIVITSDVAMTADAEEYTIAIAGKTLTGTLSADGKTLTYEMTEYDVLQGSVEKDGEASITYDAVLTFLRTADNDFMNNNVTVTLNIWAKQHRNTTDTDWDLIDSFEAVA